MPEMTFETEQVQPGPEKKIWVWNRILLYGYVLTRDPYTWLDSRIHTHWKRIDENENT